MNPTKLWVVSEVNSVQMDLIYFFSHKKLRLIPVWKKNLCFFFFSLFLKNNACLHESIRLPHMVLIFLYESHILQICADKIAGHSSCIFCFFFIFINWSFHLPFMVNWARLSAQYLNFLWAKAFPKCYSESGLKNLRKTLYFYSVDKNNLHSGS